MQLVLGYPPLQIGLAFLPANLIMAVFSVWLSAKIIDRFGIRLPLTIGLGLIGIGLCLFAITPLTGSLWLNIMPAMVALGFGCGMAFNPVLLAGTQHVPQDEAGLASGVLNTAFMMGGSLGLAILASVAAWRTSSLLAAGSSEIEALLSGYHAAFWIGGASAFGATLIALFFVQIKKGGAVAMPAH